MIEWAVTASYTMMVIGFLLGGYRMIIGPDTLNRILAFDYLSACIISFIALYSVQNKTFGYLELILIFGLLGFATVISFLEIFFAKKGELASARIQTSKHDREKDHE